MMKGDQRLTHSLALSLVHVHLMRPNSGGSRILKRGVPLIWAAGVYVYIGQTCCVNLQHLQKGGFHRTLGTPLDLPLPNKGLLHP